MLFSICSAPTWTWAYIDRAEPIQPYEKLWKAVCYVESRNDANAYHLEKNGCMSIGIVQIQQSRIDDYNRRTDSKYLLMDMYDTVKAKAVFMHYAGKYQTWQLEEIARKWNGGEPNGMKFKATLRYWDEVKKYLQ